MNLLLQVTRHYRSLLLLFFVACFLAVLIIGDYFATVHNSTTTLLTNSTTTGGYNRCSFEKLSKILTTEVPFSNNYDLPNGYNVGDLLNAPSFLEEAHWPKSYHIVQEEIAPKLILKYPKSILGLYYLNEDLSNTKKRLPYIPQLKEAVKHYGNSFIDFNIKTYIDENVKMHSSLLVHLRSCDAGNIAKAYVKDIVDKSRDFSKVILSSACHNDLRYKSITDSQKQLRSDLRNIHKEFSKRHMGCKLQMFPSNNPDDTLYAFSVARNLLLHKGGFSLIGSLLAEGKVFLSKEMKPYWEDFDYKHLVHNPVPLWDDKVVANNKDNIATFDKMAQFYPTDCVFESFGVGDEMKRICMRPYVESDDCWIMSIGSNGQFNFEESVFNKTRCQVHIFDCTGEWEVPSYISSRVKLYKKCIGTNAERSDFLPYLDLVKIARNGNLSRPAFLKMDVEGFEFAVLPELLKSPPMYKPEQIGVELHLTTYLNASQEYSQEQDGYWRLQDRSDLNHLLFHMYKLGNYRLISRVDNPFCLHCTEVVFMNLGDTHL